MNPYNRYVKNIVLESEVEFKKKNEKSRATKLNNKELREEFDMKRIGTE